MSKVQKNTAQTAANTNNKLDLQIEQIIDAAAGFSETAHEAANNEWTSAQNLINYLLTDHVAKRYHKQFRALTDRIVKPAKATKDANMGNGGAVAPVAAVRRKPVNLDQDPTPDEPKQTAKPAAKKPAKKAPVKTRMQAACEVMTKLSKPTIIADVARRVDEMFTKAGGPSNIKQTIHLIKVILPAAVAWGVVEKDSDGKLKSK